MKTYDTIDYAQYERNNKLSFAIASMAFDGYTHIVLRKRLSDGSLGMLAGGRPADILSRYGDMEIERASVTFEGLLLIVVRD